MPTRISAVAARPSKAKLAELCARRMLADIEESYGDIVDFSERLTGFPEQYLMDLALSAIDCVRHHERPVAWIPNQSLDALHRDGSHVAVQTAIHNTPPKSGNGVAVYLLETEGPTNV